jgi:1,4-alpha-glucan branching enzyme
MYGHPGKKLLFMGGEFAETSEWAEDRALHWYLLNHDRHQGVKNLVDDLNRLYQDEGALYEIDREGDGFEWIELGHRTPSLFAFLRKAEDPSDHLLFVLNFSGEKIDNYHLGPFDAVQYEIVFNSDSEYYGGSNNGGHYGQMGGQHIWMEPFSGLILKPADKKS